MLVVEKICVVEGSEGRGNVYRIIGHTFNKTHFLFLKNDG